MIHPNSDLNNISELIGLRSQNWSIIIIIIIIIIILFFLAIGLGSKSEVEIHC